MAPRMPRYGRASEAEATSAWSNLLKGTENFESSLGLGYESEIPKPLDPDPACVSELESRARQVERDHAGVRERLQVRGDDRRCS
jgi:hypothetical protein